MPTQTPPPVWNPDPLPPPDHKYTPSTRQGLGLGCVALAILIPVVWFLLYTFHIFG